jgi:hypothetical protein
MQRGVSVQEREAKRAKAAAAAAAQAAEAAEAKKTPKPGEPGYRWHATVPQPSKMDYTKRPESKVTPRFPFVEWRWGSALRKQYRWEFRGR